MNRRTFLQSVVGGAGAVGLAGCLGSGGQPIQLSTIDLVNSNGQPHSIALEVVFDGDSIVDETYELTDGESIDRINSDLPDREGKYEITVEPDAEDIEGNTFVPGEQTEADCGALTIELLRNQVLQSFEDNC